MFHSITNKSMGVAYAREFLIIQSVYYTLLFSLRILIILCNHPIFILQDLFLIIFNYISVRKIK